MHAQLEHATKSRKSIRPSPRSHAPAAKHLCSLIKNCFGSCWSYFRSNSRTSLQIRLFRSRGESFRGSPSGYHHGQASQNAVNLVGLSHAHSWQQLASTTANRSHRNQSKSPPGLRDAQVGGAHEAVPLHVQRVKPQWVDKTTSEVLDVKWRPLRVALLAIPVRWRTRGKPFAIGELASSGHVDTCKDLSQLCGRVAAVLAPELDEFEAADPRIKS